MTEMAPQPFSEEILREKYAAPGERTVEDVRRRVAKALAQNEPEPERSRWEQAFLEAMRAGFTPAGRINAAAGLARKTTWLNCFVQPVGDSMSGQDGDGLPGIMVALQEAAETMRRGGGVGYGFSRIRPRGARVKGTDSDASGPLSYMRTFDAMCNTVISAGARRGAQMGILRCDHPDIEAFVESKARPYEEKDLKTFNISVAVTDAFMKAVEEDAEWALVHPAEPSEAQKAAGAYRRDDGLWVYRTIRARELWDKIMRATYDYADPGVVFIDRMNEMNNLWYAERIEATNP